MNNKEIITEKIIESKETKMQFILDENGKLAEISKDQCKPVEHPIKYKLKNAFEVFVRVNDTENYWISNYGRCVNNLNRKDKNTYYEHKQGKCHYTVFAVERQIVSYPTKKLKSGRKPDKKRGRVEKVFCSNVPEEECLSFLEQKRKENERRAYSILKTRHRLETSPERLVASVFLEKYKGRERIWHKDGDESNNWYKNLLTVTEEDYRSLKAGRVTWRELNLEQGYIEYENKASFNAYSVYNGILARCKSTRKAAPIRKCYENTAMWQGWVDDPRAFVEWYLDHYYEVDGEEMDVDKDLFGGGLDMYHPDNCCILPKGLNTLLANSKKHYKDGENPGNTLPLGVRYSSRTKKYHAEIAFTGGGRLIPLTEFDTPEQAFAEYKIMKQADILRVAAEYKNKIPDYIYKKLLEVEVGPY